MTIRGQSYIIVTEMISCQSLHRYILSHMQAAIRSFFVVFFITNWRCLPFSVQRNTEISCCVPILITNPHPHPPQRNVSMAAVWDMDTKISHLILPFILFTKNI